MSTNTPRNPRKKAPPIRAVPEGDQAAELIRQKIAHVYDEEPSANAELQESESTNKRSRHQEFMYQLGLSGKDLATIQTEWHNYYQSLSAADKHQVWQEFYASQSAVTGQAAPTRTPSRSNAQALAKHKHQAARPNRLRDARNRQDVQAAIRDKVSAGGKLEAKHHLQSLLFGLGMGLVVLLIFLFGFFNEVVIAPFIQPSRTTAATPIIVSSNSVAPTNTPEVIIPKINVEIPTVYNQPSTNESDIENSLQDGVVHYPTTSLPGQNGNAAFFGHSSNNIFNKGKYKFAFVLLHTLTKGDTFYLTYEGKVYVYKVISRDIVDPSNIGVLDPVAGQTATATLITCDPPGTSLHRLVVVGQQISPDPSGNSQSSATTTDNAPSAVGLPGDGPTLWTRLIRTWLGKIVILGGLAGLALLAVRWLNRQISDLIS